MLQSFLIAEDKFIKQAELSNKALLVLQCFFKKIELVGLTLCPYLTKIFHTWENNINRVKPSEFLSLNMVIISTFKGRVETSGT